MAHTKGDWFYDERTESIGFAGGWLGSTKGREGEGLGDQHDDGHLLAAASRMLEACEAAYELYNEQMRILTGCGFDKPEENDTVGKMLQAAIAKARGE